MIISFISIPKALFLKSLLTQHLYNDDKSNFIIKHIIKSNEICRIFNCCKPFFFYIWFNNRFIIGIYNSKHIRICINCPTQYELKKFSPWLYNSHLTQFIKWK